MPLAAPKLDDRRFQEIVDEAKKRIPRHIEAWTDHNVSDPGVTLIELFAWMTEMILYRLNQVPERHYIKFMEMMGIQLREPVPAQVPVTFWLSAPQETDVVIPAGTEVASTQTETEPSIIYTINQDLKVQPPQLAAVLAGTAGEGERAFRTLSLRRLGAGGEAYDVFSKEPKEDDALYVGFENRLSHHILGFQMDWDPAGGAGVDPTLPPYVWEAATTDGWQPCEVEMDTTKALNVAGRIRLHLPALARRRVDGKDLYWVRVRLEAVTRAQRREGMRPYRQSPRLRQMSAATWGGTVPATHARTVHREFLGQSDGSPGQRFVLQGTPVLARQPGETLLVQLEEEAEQLWQEVTDFADSGAYDRHFTLDSVSGEVRLGPAVRQPDGTIKLYGAVPARGANLLFTRYRHGGGEQGNVQAGVLNTLKTAIPYVSRVSNRVPAQGGLDAESLEAAKMRVPRMLRTRGRAVTEGDFEFLAGEALPAAIGRVRCLQPRPSAAGRVRPGQVYVLVVPRLEEAARLLDPRELELDPAQMARLTAFLDERRLLTTRLEVRSPVYRWVAVRAQLRADPAAEEAVVEAEAKARLYRFLNPLTGGPDGTGWPFGRDLFLSDVYQALQGLPHVQFVRSVEMFAAEPGGPARGEAVESLEVVAHAVVASGEHEVVFV